MYDSGQEPVRDNENRLSRRRVLGSGALLGAATAVGTTVGVGSGHGDPAGPEVLGAGGVDITLRVNGRDRALRVEPRVTLLDALRERLDLTGTKKGCDQGACGACTVLVDGERVNACLTLAIMVRDKEITTIEGLARGDRLSPVQEAFLDRDAFQCGYCTPGQIVSATALIAEGHTRSAEEIREWMSGNICRCAAYPNIVAAIEDVAR
ncbi:xanthine dehydrogenase YagT iron-sulfur-binding subunit [Herbihabitans rhizosphaerae]|uniref:Xanthine dehydrogenase YagT iron-sulfur-binding subunit n=1 Tax=Herbihabitans rhizosphaerae TaxID=1872711 RepID=A0A4Q7KMK5_9PSEU|nr:xanthine dehydrogenase YagT iron-sulfur-binding subunit [Herbihabitans rhizosphaerae]